MDALGKVASTAIDLCGWALDCDKIGQDMANALHGLCPEIFSGIGLYWRSDVIIAGMIISGIATIAALVEGVMGIALATFACFLILSFSLYYISRYAEISEMEAQLNQLNEVRTDLKGQVDKFTDENQKLNYAVGVLSKGAENLQETIELSQNLETKIEANLKRLEQLQIENAKAESRRESNTAKNQKLQRDIASKAETLATVTDQLLALKEEFVEIKNSLSTSADKSDTHASHLQSLANQLEGIVTRVNSQISSPKTNGQGFIDV